MTSLRHPQNSTDYSHVESLLEQTLHSVCSQSVDDYFVVVVGNRPPSFDLPAGVQYVNCDFPPPVATTGAVFPLGPFVWDKGTKVGLGLAVAAERSPSRAMIFDADDLIHRDLARFAATTAAEEVLVVDKGYVYSDARRAYRKVNQFNRTCGTCHVVPFSAYETDKPLSIQSTQTEVAEAYGERIEKIIGAHRNSLTWFKSHGYAVRQVPFRSAVYRVDTGENHSGKQLEGFAMPLGRRFAEDFSVESTMTPSVLEVAQDFARFSNYVHAARSVRARIWPRTDQS